MSVTFEPAEEALKRYRRMQDELREEIARYQSGQFRILWSTAASQQPNEDFTDRAVQALQRVLADLEALIVDVERTGIP